jgi:hypothetical protein
VRAIGILTAVVLASIGIGVTPIGFSGDVGVPPVQALAVEHATVPTLGTKGPPESPPTTARGWGEIRPNVIYNGGDPTGLVKDISWSTWGGAQAIGHGLAVYLAPGASDAAHGVFTSATVVAFDLGKCDGKDAYLAVKWYFPGKVPEPFSSGAFETTCNGQGFWPIETGDYEDGGVGGGVGSSHFAFSLTGGPSHLRGSFDYVSAEGHSTLLFKFTAVAAVSGAFAMTSSGPVDAGKLFGGRWGSVSVVLSDCHALLDTEPATYRSCTFY